MKRWRLVILVFVVIGALGYALHRHHARLEEQRREISYQQTLRSYSEALKPGTTRQKVEDYLRSRALSFRQSCCLQPATGVNDYLVKIGEESPPWYCRDLNVYIGFKFTPHAKHDIAFPVSDPQDMLKTVEVYRLTE